MTKGENEDLKRGKGENAKSTASPSETKEVKTKPAPNGEGRGLEGIAAGAD